MRTTGTSPVKSGGKLPPHALGETSPSSSKSPAQLPKDAKAAWSLRERRTAASTRGTSTPRTSAMAVISLTGGSAPGRPSSRRTYVMTERPGAVTSFVARPAARRRAAKGGSSGSTSRRCNGSRPSAAASRGTKRGRGRSSPVSQTRMRAGLESSSFVASSYLLSPMASQAACRRSPRTSGRATAAPHHPIGGHLPVALDPSAHRRPPRRFAPPVRIIYALRRRAHERIDDRVSVVRAVGQGPEMNRRTAC